VIAVASLAACDTVAEKFGPAKAGGNVVI